MSAVFPPLHKKPQTRDERQSTRRSISNMTPDYSCIKDALLVRCSHVSMMIKEREDLGNMSTQRGMHERSKAVPAHKTSKASDKRQSARRSINNNAQDDSCIKGALPECCIHVSMVLQEQADSGILVKERSHTIHERSFHISVYKKHQATDNLQATMRSSINNMTQDESRIKGALLVRCIHVSMMLKEQKDNGIIFT
jgi:hypothetical protein